MSNNFTDRYTADGVCTIFGFNFPVPDESWVHVEELLPAATSFVDAQGYIVERMTKGGNVIFKEPPPTNTVVMISPKQPGVASLMPSSVPQPAESESPNSLSALIFEEFKSSYKTYLRQVQDFQDYLARFDSDLNVKASELLRDANTKQEQTLAKMEAMLRSAERDTKQQIQLLNDQVAKIITEVRTEVTQTNSETTSEIREEAHKSLTSLEEKLGIVTNTISVLGEEKLKAITEIAVKYDTKLSEIYSAKAKQLNDFNLQVSGLVANATNESKESFQQIYDEFILQVNKIKDDLFAVVETTREALEEENLKTIQGIKDTGDQACAELKKAQEDFKVDIKRYAEQMEECVKRACMYKKLAYSAAGNKGWIVYRKVMPSTDAEIKELHSIINDGGLVIAATEYPEDGGGNPTGGTNTQDFWCMVKAVAAYQKVVEQLLAGISPEDLENLHEYFEYLSNVLAELEKQEQLIKGLNITTVSLDERIKRADEQIQLLQQQSITQHAAILDLQTKLIDLAMLVDQNMEQNKLDLHTQIEALKEEHERLGFLYASLDKRLQVLERK